MTTSPNPEMLALGRKLRGLRQSQFAQEVGIQQAALSRYETGARVIPDEHLELIAKKLNLPLSFFYRRDEVFGLGSNGLYHRRRQTVSTVKLDEIESRINFVSFQVRQMLEAAAFESPFSFPSYPLDEFNGDVAGIAELVRAAWRLPSGPILNLTRAIENAGGVVVMQDFGTRQIDAFAFRTPGAPPIFLVNKNVPGDRLRFTLAHEIGHLVMHEVPSDNIETEADEFAAAFLMPARDIRLELAPVEIPHLAQLKLRWRVSIQAMARRARDLGIIDAMKYRSFFKQMSQAGLRQNEPNPIPPEQPALLFQLVNLHLRDLGYSTRELAALLTMDAREFEDVYLEQPSLRIVEKNR